MQDSANLTGAPTGQTLSGGSFTPSGWQNAALDVPGTVLTCLSDSLNPMHLYPNPVVGNTMRWATGEFSTSGTDGSFPIPDISGRQQKFWYYSTVTLSANDIQSGKVNWLCFDGINYMADIYLNGQYLPLATDPFNQLQSTNSYYNGSTAGTAGSGSAPVSGPVLYTHTIVGAMKRAKFNVTGLATTGTNYIAVKIYPNLNPGNFHNKVASSCGSNGGWVTTDGPTFISARAGIGSPPVPIAPWASTTRFTC